MKKRTKILSVIGVGLVLLVFAIFRSNYFKQEPFTIHASNLAILEEEENTYYLKQAPKDIQFEVFLKSNGENFDYTLVDEAGEEVETSVEETGDDSYEINAPSAGYTEGQRYTLTLGPDVLFLDENLVHADSLLFAIERAPIEDYTFTDAVIEVNQPIVEVDEETVQVQDFDGQVDDLVFGLNQEEKYVVYKIKDVQDSETYTITHPALDEIYADLDVSGEYELDFHEIVAMPEVETQIVDQIKASDFYAELAMAAYPGLENENIAIGVELAENPEKNRLDFKIKLTIKPTDDGLFGEKQFKNQEVTLILANTVDAKAHVDIQEVVDWDVSLTRKDDFHWALEVEILETDDQLMQALSPGNQEENMQEIIQILQEIIADEATSQIDLFEQELLIEGVPGLKIQTLVNLPLQFKLSADVLFENQYSTTSTVGLSFREQAFSPYSYLIEQPEEGDFTVKGRVDSKTGVQFDTRTTLFHEDIATIHLQPEVGLTLKGYSALTLSEEMNDAEEVYGYFDSQIYFDTLITGHFQTVAEDFTFDGEMIEKKIAINELSMGTDSITTGIETAETAVESRDWFATPPAFYLTVYHLNDETSESQPINFDDLLFISDEGTELQKQDQMLVIPETEAEELTIIARYDYSENQTFEQAFEVGITENKMVSLAEHPEFRQSMEFFLTLAPGGNIPDYTSITLNQDGSFSGEYIGVEGMQAHPDLIYESEFSGQFEIIEKTGEYTYSLRRSELNYAKSMGTRWSDGQIPYEATPAIGIDEGEYFTLYAPGIPVEEIPVDTRRWSTTYWDMEGYADPAPDYLECWLLRNMDTDRGFYTPSIHDRN